MSDKKILFIINGLGYGGAETQLLRLSKVLVNYGYDISILTISKDLALLPQLDRRINHYNIPLQKNIKLLTNLIRIVRLVNQEQPDVIHAHLFQANIISRLIKILNKKIRVINTTHGAYLLNTRNYNPYKIYKLTRRWVDYHTAVSQEVLDLLIKNKSINHKKSSFIPNGLFVNKYTTSQFINNPFKWLSIGRFHPVKQYATLIEAMSIVKNNNTDFVLHIAGDGEERNKLETIIKDSSLETHVTLLGLINDIPKLLSEYDGFVISSLSEGLPMVLLEAMSASLPIVSTDVGEVAEIINKANGGIIISKKDKVTIADAMQKLMEFDKNKLHKFGDNNRKFVKENYDIEILVKTWLKIYFVE